MAEKRGQSTSSFVVEKQGRLHRNPSLQLQNKLDHQPSIKFSAIVEAALRRFSESQTNFRWELERLEEKRRLLGLKVKLRWRDISKKYTMLLKMCVPNNYDNKATRIYDSDDFILELESANFEMSPRQLKNLQRFFDSQMKTITIKNAPEEDWLLHILEKISQRMASEDKSEFKDKREIINEEAIDKSLVNENYIICPSPIAIAWNPMGQLTISQHRTIPRAKGSYIGNRRFLTYAFESCKPGNLLVRSKEQNALFQQISSEIQEMDESVPSSIYDWSLEENEDFMDKEVGQLEKTLSPSVFDDEARKLPQKKRQKVAQVKKSDEVVLVDLTKISPELAKFYKTHFTRVASVENPLLLNETIRTFRIEGPDKELESELMFLLYRIGESRDGSVIENVLKTELAGYGKMLSQHEDLSTQYMVIREVLSSRLTATQYLPLFLKAMMAENDLISQLLGRWFGTAANRLSLSQGQLKSITALNNSLGSYLHFEYLKCQEILMELLKAATFKPFKPELAGSFVVKITSYLTPFEPQFILTQAEAVEFYRKIIPILELRNRSASYLEYRKIMRIILANDQLKDFVRIMNSLIHLHRSNESSKRQFLLELIGAYGRKSDTPGSGAYVRRQYRVECMKCGNLAETYELPNSDIKCQCLRK